MMKHHPDGPDVRASVGGTAFGLLGSHGPRSAAGDANEPARDLLVPVQARQTEIENLDPSVPEDEDVLRLEIEVQDAE